MNTKIIKTKLTKELEGKILNEMETRAEQRTLIFTYELSNHLNKDVWFLEEDGQICCVALLEPLNDSTYDNLSEDLESGFMCNDKNIFRYVLNNKNSFSYISAIFSFENKKGYGEKLINSIKEDNPQILLSSLFTAEKFWKKMGFKYMGGTSNYYYWENKNVYKKVS